MMTKAEQIQLFLKEAREQFSDMLTLDARGAWEKLRSGQPLLHGIQISWKREQVAQAVPRILRAVAPLPIPVETEANRLQLIAQLLIVADDVPDTILIAWLRAASSAEMRLLQDHLTKQLPECNITGYRAIAAEAQRIGWPKFYREDLTVDLTLLCSPGAPKEFWWGIRATGTDLFSPNALASVEWALAIKKNGNEDERLHYHYTGNTLRRISLDTLIVQLVRSLRSKEYEQRWHDAAQAKLNAGERHFRTRQQHITYEQASLVASQAENAYRRVVYLKSRYQS